jgi:hypothetical protein
MISGESDGSAALIACADLGAVLDEDVPPIEAAD